MFQKKIVKYLIRIVLSLIVLAILLTAFLQTSVFKNWLKGRLLTYSNSVFNGELDVEGLHGNLFSYVVIDNLSWRSDENSWLTFHKAVLRYNLLFLLLGEIRIHEIVLEQPELSLLQMGDGSWNVNHFLKGQGDSHDTTPIDGASSWLITVDDAQILAGRINIVADSSDRVFPEKIKGLEARLRFGYRGEQFGLSGTQLQFEAEGPEYRFKTMVSEMMVHSEGLDLAEITIQTDSTTLSSSLQIRDFTTPWIDFSATAESVALSDIRRAIPDFKFYGNPKFVAQANGPLETLDVNFEVQFEEGGFEVGGLLRQRDESFGYDLKGAISQINLRDLTRRADLTTDLNMRFLVRGQNLQWGQINGDYRLEFHPSFFNEYRVRSALLSGSIRGDTLTFSADIASTEGAVIANGHWIGGLGNPAYRISGQVFDLNLQDFLHTPNLMTELNFNFDLHGRGLDWGKLAADLSLDAHRSRINDIELDSAFVDVSLADQNVILRKLTLRAPEIELSAAGDLSRLARSNVHFKANVSDFNAFSNFVPVDSLAGQGNVSGELIGMLGSIAARVQFDLDQLTFGASTFKSLHGDLEGFFSTQLDSLQLTGNAVNAKLVGLDSLSSRFRVQYTPVSALFDLDINRNDRFLGATRGEVAFGLDQQKLRFEQLEFIGLGELWKLTTRENEIDFSDTEVSVSNFVLESGHQSVEFAGKVNRHGQSDFNLRLTRIDLSTFDRLPTQNLQSRGFLDFELVLRDSLSNPDLHGNAKLNGGELSGVRMDQLALNFDYVDRKLTWEMDVSAAGKDSLVNFAGFLPLYLSLNPFELKILDEPLEMNAYVPGFDLATIDKVFFEDRETRSYFDVDSPIELRAKLTGKMHQPIFTTSFVVDRGRYKGVPFEQLRGQLHYNENLLTWDCGLSGTSKDSQLSSSGFLPVKFSVRPYHFSLLQEKPVEVRLSSRGFDLSLFEPFAKNIRNLRGTLVADLVLSNTMNDLTGAGSVRVTEASLDLPEWGTRYRNVNVALVLRGRELLIRDFRMRSGSGTLNLVGGSLSLSKTEIERFNVQLQAKNFQLMNNKKMRARVNGDITLSGSIQAPHFGGELNVIQANIFYPAWFEEEAAQVTIAEVPFFVMVDDSATDHSLNDKLRSTQLPAQKGQISASQLYKSLLGELTIRAAKNVWLRSEQTNIELSGELQLVKAGPEFELFGTVSAVRGFYELFGNRFQIREGSLSFPGGVEINPEVRIEAVHRFFYTESENRERHELTVFITGTRQVPQFRFTLDGAEADQRDVLSILLFGRNFEDLSSGQRTSFTEFANIEKKAAGFLTDQLIRRLSRSVGSRLALDVLQYESTKNSSEARLSVGKYVTSDVFVTISQDFGGEGNQRIELEYELPKILLFDLLLQATQERKGRTGLDLFWRIIW